MVACSKENEALIQEKIEQHEARRLGGDTELEDWVDEHRTEIIEGRKSIYGEKSGFWVPPELK